MKFLYDLFPLLLFFAAFKLYGIYVATAVAIAASFVQVGSFWLRHRRFETMHLVTLGVLAVFGGLTLLLQDDTFIKWKPTLVYWILAALVLGSQWVGRKTAIERILGAQISLPPAVWARQNLSWGVFFAALGGLNLYVAFYYGLDLEPAARQEIWVNFKVFGLLGITLAFTLLQGALMARHIIEKPDKDASAS
ncbi:septation protein A [Sulfurifustis variabilis]|uniref:Inner membrane-spanning protein YciB n=1 Tax=Sulfurifustis variabilis TaxID=1675686 RepID=A0A1B4VBB3_9GAMM|nr:septation protein A [Sulfurifustis variabilis]BAU47761.1 septation protein A [Sulfurifustis variabilis]